MSSTLDDLFEKIIHSEKAAQERKNFLAELRQGVNRTSVKLCEEQQKSRSLEKELETKTHQLNEEQLKVKWLRNCEEIYQAQRDDLQRQKDQLQQTLSDIKEQHTKGMMEFCSELHDFTSNFDLSGHGAQCRQDETEEKLQQAVQQQVAFATELEDYNKKQQQLQETCRHRDKLLQELALYTDADNALSIKLGQCLEATADLELEKTKVSNFLHIDPELLSLQDQLAEAKSSNLEEQCSHLQAEYQNVQQQLWQKQLHQRQLQQRQQQQQQKQQQQQQTKLQQQPECHREARSQDDDSEYSMELLTDIFTDDETEISDDQNPDNSHMAATPHDVPSTNHRMIFKSGKARDIKS